jgi:hypothetical protein
MLRIAAPILIAAVALLPFGAVQAAADGKSFSATDGKSSSVEEDIGDMSKEAGDGAVTSRFRFNVQTRAEYVTNARLQGDHDDSDFLLLPKIEAGYNLPLGKGLSLDFLGRLEAIGYLSDEDRSIYGASGAVTLGYQPKVNWPRFYGAVEPYHYDSASGDTDAEAVAFVGGVEQEHVLNAGRTLLWGGYQFSNFQADPGLDNRNSHRGIIGVTHQLRPNMFGQLYYSYQFTTFRQYDRDDYRHLAGATFLYQFTDRCFGSVSATFIDNDSEFSTANYQNFALGAGLSYQF